MSIYDNVSEYRREQLSQTTCPLEPRPCLERQQQQQQQRPAEPKATPSTNEHLQLRQVRVPSFQAFQAAIELQLATISETQAANKNLHALSLDYPTIDKDDDAVADSDSTEVEDCESDSDGDTYDSYNGDGDGDWRDDEDGEREDSMTDPESVRSECSSPVEGEEEEKEDYFGLRHLASLVVGGI
jgi:hypothetical protein